MHSEWKHKMAVMVYWMQDHFIWVIVILVVIFGMYADDTYSFVQKDEMDRRVLETEGQVSSSLSSLFHDVSHFLHN